MHECSCVIYHLYTCIIKKKMVCKLQHCCQNIVQYKLVCKNPSNPGSAIPWKIVILTTPWQKKCPPHEPYISTPCRTYIHVDLIWLFSIFSPCNLVFVPMASDIYIYPHFESIYDLPSPPSANEWFFIGWWSLY
jgi:hypothetical protein